MNFQFRSYHSQIFIQDPVREVKTDEAFTQVKILPYQDYDIELDEGRDIIGPLQYFLLKENLGVINWKGSIQLQENAIPKYFMLPNYFFLGHDGTYSSFLNPYYKGEAFFSKDINRASITHFSPLRLVIDVELNEPDTLIINQNYDKSWHTSQGPLTSQKGLLGIPLQKLGNYSVEFNYIPLDFYIGLFISLATLIFILVWYLKSKNRYAHTSLHESYCLQEQGKKSLKDTFAIFIGVIVLFYQAYDYTGTENVNPFEREKSSQQEIKDFKNLSEFKSEEIYGVRKWEVGQYAMYKITDSDEGGEAYKYRVAIVAKETIGKEEHFWLEHALLDSNGKPRAVFKFLMQPLSAKEIEKNPLSFFMKGLYTKKTKKLIAQFEDNPSYEIDAEKMDEMIKSYSTIPYPKAILNKGYRYNKDEVKIFVKEEKRKIPLGVIDCYHFLIELSSKPSAYRFSLWRSKEVPILGLVKMDLYTATAPFDFNEFPNKIVLIEYKK